MDRAPLDLRPRVARTATVEVPLHLPLDDVLARLDWMPPRPLEGLPEAQRDASGLLGGLREAGLLAGELLDLGCGPRDQAPVAEYLGFRYVGLDIAGTTPDVLGDAHALPFLGESFDAVLAYAVLEHLHAPLVALSEICRVLRPGGRVVGTVSLGEPFHASFFHFTPWGVVAAAGATGLHVERLWGSRDTLLALAAMSGYPRVVRWMLRAVHALHRRLPILSPRRFFSSTSQDRALDAATRAGSVCFLLQRPIRGAPSDRREPS